MPKKKGDKGGNPAPVQTPEFISQQKPPAPDVEPGVELSKKVIGLKLPVEIDAIVRSMPNGERSIWLRKAITNQLKSDGLL